MTPIMRSLSVAVCLFFTATCGNAQTQQYPDYYTNYSSEIVPRPVTCNIDSGSRAMRIGNGTCVVFSDSSELKAAQYFADYVDKYFGISVKLAKKSPVTPCITFINARNGGKQGGYTLNVDSTRGAVVRGNDEQGTFYGMVTLLQMLPTRAGVLPVLPGASITDAPWFDYRGMHLDVVRHFFPVSFVKRYIDWLALHKMNYFHWHLTDDQGWRIEIKSHPELSAGAQNRAGEIEGVFPGSYRELPYGAYYTQEQIREVIRYAADRCVTVIPEIDVPGHCMAVLSAHPEFSTTPDIPKTTARTWGIYNRQNNVLAPTPEVFRFLDDVFNEVCDLFPGGYVHAGGDECAPKWWKESKSTQKFIKKHGLIDENSLQRYFMDYVRRIVNAHGKTLIGWNGGIEQCDSAGTVVENWHHRSATNTKQITPGHRTIVASGRWFYFDYREDSTHKITMSDRKRLLTVKNVYDFNIVPDSATEVEARNIIGAEGCMWTEYIPAEWKAEQMVFPRLAALSENMWLGPQRNWVDFQRRLVRQSERYDLWGIRYNPIYFLNQSPDPRYR